MQMRAKDLMDPEVTKVPPGVPASDLARMFADRGISTVAVVGPDGELQGIVTEADLIRRLTDEDERSQAGWLARLLSNPNIAAERYLRSHGRTAGDLMTKEVVTVGPEDSAAHIARLMDEHKIRRVLVMEGGKLIGLVNRPSLLRALIEPAKGTPTELSDEDIRQTVLAAMRREEWATTGNIAVGVRDGIVEFSGFRHSEAVSRALRVLAESVPGVTQVVDRTLAKPVVFGP
jgi:CBS domain-containing protein